MRSLSDLEPEQDHQFWYRQKVIERIWYYQNKFKPLHENILSKSEYDLNDFELIRAARVFFGSWKNSLDAAGIMQKRAQNGWGKKQRTEISKVQFTKQRLLEIISGLAKSGENMSPENIVVMHNDVWQNACGKNGYFSHWPTAMRSAGIEINAIDNTPQWTVLSVKNRILDLYESQLLLSKGHIRDNFWYLYRYGCRMFGSWPNAVDSTGLGYETVKEEYENYEVYQLKFQQNLIEVLHRLGRPVRLLREKSDSMQSQIGRQPLDIFAVDDTSGTAVGTLLRSWWPGIERPLIQQLATLDFPRVDLYYIQGEPRVWKDNKVNFIAASDILPESLEAGADEYMKCIMELQYNVPSFL